MNPAAMRLLNQQLAAPSCISPHDAVSRMGFIQAQQYRMMRWAVGMRMKNPSAKQFEQEFNEGKIVRMHLFRCTWQLATAEDAHWMRELCREKNISAIRGYLKYYGQSVSEAEYARSNDLIADFIDGKRSVGRDELEKLLAEKGPYADKHTISILLRRAEFDGIICSGDLEEKRTTYAPMWQKIPRKNSISAEEAATMLAKKYFQSHSPATLDDFAWWSNLPAGTCRKAAAALGTELHKCRIGDAEYYVHDSCRTRGAKGGAVHLLPSYDEYLIGYKSRHLAAAPEHMKFIHDNKGIFWPVLLHDARAAGNWKIAKNGVSVSFFDGRNDISPEILEPKIRAVEKFFGI